MYKCMSEGKHQIIGKYPAATTKVPKPGQKQYCNTKAKKKVVQA